MAKKSKTQRAKASAARQQRKAERENEALVETTEPAEEEPKKKSLFKKSSPEPDQSKPQKSEPKPKTKRFQFFRDVKAEMKRVTWPTRTDVLRWTGVVIVALLFFGVFVALLDNVIVTPLLVFVSGL